MTSSQTWPTREEWASAPYRAFLPEDFWPSLSEVATPAEIAEAKDAVYRAWCSMRIENRPAVRRRYRRALTLLAENTVPAILSDGNQHPALAEIHRRAWDLANARHAERARRLAELRATDAAWAVELERRERIERQREWASGPQP